jgi:hypothetical protein
MGEGHLRKKIEILNSLSTILLYSLIIIDTPFPQIEIHVNIGNMYDIQVTNKTVQVLKHKDLSTF